MGDRAVIHFHDGKDIGPAIYLHSCGGSEGVKALIDETRAWMTGRSGDVAYTTARCIGLAHESLKTTSDSKLINTGLGCWSVVDFAEVRAEDYSHGDAGVFLVDCRTWEIETFGGYGFTELKAHA